MQKPNAACSLHKGTTIMQILPLCYLHLVAASRTPVVVPKMVLTLQPALVVFFLPSTIQRKYSTCTHHLVWSSSTATCAGSVIIICRFSIHFHMLIAFNSQLLVGHCVAHCTYVHSCLIMVIIISVDKTLSLQLDADLQKIMHAYKLYPLCKLKHIIIYNYIASIYIIILLINTIYVYGCTRYSPMHVTNH